MEAREKQKKESKNRKMRKFMAHLDVWRLLSAAYTFLRPCTRANRTSGRV